MHIVTNVFKTLAKGLAWTYAFIFMVLLGLIVLTNVMLNFVT